MPQSDRNTSVLLLPEQYNTIAELANTQDRTISEVVRDIIRLGLETLERENANHQETLERLNQRRLEYHRLNGTYPGDPIAEVRAERERQIETVIKGEA